MSDTTAWLTSENVWEQAYLRFETPQEEIRKFQRRLRRLGAAQWDRSSRIVEIFCGRGNGLIALESLGFTHIEGVDLSPRLLQQYTGTARMIEADCRQLPFEDHSRDILIVQGGLHHLAKLPEDVEAVLREVVRVLTPQGRLVMVEPWRTPFLTAVHWLCDQAWARWCSNKIHMLAVMTENEIVTYTQWLSQPQKLLELFSRYLTFERQYIRWGKLMLVGQPKSPAAN
ncbi:MAG: Ubiquinone/menaquinone biosynthesis C-methyltransferase UbiE [Phycisphaerae bacterium]|nr:Ubiquinone/menaquinone biosynthesis C-methyltransferase UbiE [Phycisphaerae bacterium]